MAAGRTTLTTVGLIAAGFALGQVARGLSMRTGVSDQEAFGALPGDEIIPHPMVEWTRGTTVRATRDSVWPWLAQMGYGRGGWYTPDWVDLIANRWFFGIKQPFPPSTNRLLPEYQHVEVGDLICDGPSYASFFRVQLVDPPHAIVYRSIRHIRRGSPIGSPDPWAAERIERELIASGSYVDFTWALVLNETAGKSSRLLVRTRANVFPRSVRALSLPMGLFDATYGVAQLRAIARRAELVPAGEHRVSA